MKLNVYWFYGGIAVLALVISIFFRVVADNVPETSVPIAKDVGAQQVDVFFPIKDNLEMINQEDEKVGLSDLKGKITVLCEFFATCPHCAMRNAVELKEIAKKFGDHPDFHIICISVDPETDGLEKLREYSEMMGADAKNWWFTRADSTTETHEFLEKKLGFFQIRERLDEVDILSNGRYAHDLSLMVIDRDLNVVGKYPLADARSDEAKQRDPGLYDRLEKKMYGQIQELLEKKVALNSDHMPQRGNNAIAQGETLGF